MCHYLSIYGVRKPTFFVLIIHQPILVQRQEDSDIRDFLTCWGQFVLRSEFRLPLALSQFVLFAVMISWFRFISIPSRPQLVSISISFHWLYDLKLCNHRSAPSYICFATHRQYSPCAHHTSPSNNYQHAHPKWLASLSATANYATSLLGWP